MNYQPAEITFADSTYSAAVCPKCVGSAKIYPPSALPDHMRRHELQMTEYVQCKECGEEFQNAIVDGARLPTRKCPKCRVKRAGLQDRFTKKRDRMSSTGVQFRKAVKQAPGRA